MTFEKHFNSYEENAIVQKKVAKHLASFFTNILNPPKTILEIGCGTGIFSRELVRYFPNSSLSLNDIFDTSAFFDNISYEKFIVHNAETMSLDSYDLISSSGCFQWFTDLQTFLEKLSSHTNCLVFSMFLEDNLKEIKDHFQITLAYPSVSETIHTLRKHYSKVEYQEEIFEIDFPTPLAALRHLQATGVTGIGETNIRKIRSYPHKKLTYRVGYFKAERAN